MPAATTRRGLLAGGMTASGIVLGGAVWPGPARGQIDTGRLRLSLNENPWGPSPQVEPAIRAALGQVNRYVEDEAAGFEQVVATFEGVGTDQVVLGEVLGPLGLHLALEGGQASRFVYSSPGYAGFTDPAAAVGGTIDGVPLNAQFENDLPALLARAEGAAALFVVNPHNPSGTVSDRAAFHTFVREASLRTLVVIDEAYLEYSDDYAGRTAAPLVAEGLNVVVFRTFAKAYGLAGLQLGHAIGPKPLVAALKRKGVGAPHSLDRLALAAGTAALRDQAQVARVSAAVAREREIWRGVLDGLGWRQTATQANFVFFQADRPQAELARALAERGVDIGRAHPPLTDWTRISIGRPEENVRVQTILRGLAGGRG
jgi:histidinol-phosphate aminotransferase